MANVSPGVYVKIIDLSEYVQNVPSTIGFLALVTEKGPDNELVFTNARDFYKDFGEPNIAFGGKNYGQGPYVASAFLQNSDALYVLRVMPATAAYSNLVFYGESAGSYGADATSTLTVGSEPDMNTEAELKTIVNFEEDDSTADAAIMFCGLGRGAWYNCYKINVSAHANPYRAAEGIYVLDIFKKQDGINTDSTAGDDGNIYEIVQSFEVAFNPNKLDGSGDSLFIADVVNKYFRDLFVIADRNMCYDMCMSGTDWSLYFMHNGPQSLANGSDGNLLEGDAATQLLTLAYHGELPRVKGLSTMGALEEGEIEPPVPLSQTIDEVLNTEDFYFSIVWDAGYPRDVKDAIVTLVKTGRQDCVAILDNGDNRSVADALRMRNSVYTYNTFYAALYECYTKVYDRWSGRDIWITPVYHMASVIPYTDNVAELWYAPAGFNRGTLDGIKAMRFSPRLAERDQFYLNQINPIVKFNVGFTVWGQLTTQRRPSALQDLNIVRLVLYIKRALAQFCKFYIFEMNDSVTWAAIASNIDKFLKVIQDKRGLYGYNVDVGATEYEIKAKQIHVNVTLNPTRVVEQIYLNFFIV